MRYFVLFLLFITINLKAQENKAPVKIVVSDESGKPLQFASVALLKSPFFAETNAAGFCELQNVSPGTYTLNVLLFGYKPYKKLLSIPSPQAQKIILEKQIGELDEVVVTGSLRETSKDDSPVNIDVITPKVFQRSATPNLFEATAFVNGVKPQVNCNVCNTGDIHINGMEGPYTLILIDGMPIVSGLSSVYGLMGIPSGMVERLEIAKGPSGALFGSEAMGGTINLITKKAGTAPKFYLDYFGTSYLENNLDLATKVKIGKKLNLLSGLNAFYFDKISDINNDGFTDVTLQERISWFNKLDVERNGGRELSMAARYVYEDRWGGQTNWTPAFRGGDSVYGESIYTSRFEFLSKYEWPVKEKIFTQLSYNWHDQNSVYGTTPFLAKQSTAFAQTYWNKNIGLRNNLLAGVSFKNLWFDDNTIVTLSSDGLSNQPENNNTTGLFAQNELSVDSAGKHKLLAGLRLDYNDVYGYITSPRLAYKWSPVYKFTFRANFGTGFRVVNVFTEDHAALTGARQVIFTEKIEPEQSYNGALNLVYKMKAGRGAMIIWDAGLFYYHFTNKIFANYDEDPNKVIYQNLDGFAFSRGGALNASLANPGNFKFNFGITCADVQNVTKDSTGKLNSSRQINAPLWSGNFGLAYTFAKPALKIDITGNYYGPQRLPILPNDYRPEYSPWFCLLNLQVTKEIKKTELYGGVKNLLNFLPRDPIMRPQDPFDRQVDDAIANPNGYTFDPTYNYAPMQGIRAYLGLRVNL